MTAEEMALPRMTPDYAAALGEAAGWAVRFHRAKLDDSDVELAADEFSEWLKEAPENWSAYLEAKSRLEEHTEADRDRLTTERLCKDILLCRDARYAKPGRLRRWYARRTPLAQTVLWWTLIVIGALTVGSLVGIVVLWGSIRM